MGILSLSLSLQTTPPDTTSSANPFPFPFPTQDVSDNLYFHLLGLHRKMMESNLR